MDDMAGTNSGQDNGCEDERLEILFWWVGGDLDHGIEARLDDDLDATPSGVRRRLAWPGRPAAATMRRSSQTPL